MIELNSRQLRVGIRSPRYLAGQMAKEQARPVPPNTPRSPQRAMIDAAIRAYFASGRSEDVMLDDYDGRVAKAKRRETAATEFANGRVMLERFARSDLGQTEPLAVQLPKGRVVVGGVGITVGIDLLYASLRGRRLRLLLTDQELRREEHLRLFATAVALHFEGRMDGSAVSAVEIRRLRREDGATDWSRDMLEASAPALLRRLNEISHGGFEQVA